MENISRVRTFFEKKRRFFQMNIASGNRAIEQRLLIFNWIWSAILISISFSSAGHSPTSVHVDILAPVHFMISPFIGVGPYFDVKPSFRFKMGNSFYGEVETSIGVMDKVAFSYWSPDGEDSVLSQSPTYVGYGIGASAKIGRGKLYGNHPGFLSRTFGKNVNGFLYGQIGYSAFFPQHRLNPGTKFFKIGMEPYHVISLGPLIQIERSFSALLINLGVGYSLALTNLDDGTTFLHNALPFSGLEINAKLGFNLRKQRG